ncbi:hypothetical protein RHMOL_Rhmol10G0293000 [Rhododendron molle]|uniref:Uncharacterized protein n=1 Tax=Rhododendron molle TaxID=49168 RepID=A0ACC0M7M1_RHOML|nr:hypothetical protein RHMOL_Rhmol10G0293000 [Rhododendron molle]
MNLLVSLSLAKPYSLPSEYPFVDLPIQHLLTPLHVLSLRRVDLPNGAYLVIEQTEALVSVDVNSGKRMTNMQEEAILSVNRDAAKQIARELRLRDIGGIIVVDFLKMEDHIYKRLVYDEIKEAVKGDRSTVNISELSMNGIMEITRKRVRSSVTFLISEPCSYCKATGRVESLETSFSKIEREICRNLARMDGIAEPENAQSYPRFEVLVDRSMFNYLTSGNRKRLVVLSSALKVRIFLKIGTGLTRGKFKVPRGFTGGEFKVKPATDEEYHNNQNQVANSGLQRPNPPRRKLTIKKLKTRRK